MIKVKQSRSYGVKIKDKILRIAFQLFIQKGFREVSINDLIKESGIEPICFDNYFNSKDYLISEAIQKFFFSRFDDIIKIDNENNGSSQEQLLKIFRKYSEIEGYLNIDLSLVSFNYNSIICLMVEGIKGYESMTRCIVDFNNRLLEKIKCIIEYGKRQGEISNSIDPKSTAKCILESLQNNIVLWAMNKNVNIKMLYETNFRYLWRNIKSYEIS